MPKAYLDLGVHYINSNQFSKGRVVFDFLQTKFPNSQASINSLPNYYLELGKKYSEKKEWDNSFDAYRNLLLKYPDSSAAIMAYQEIDKTLKILLPSLITSTDSETSYQKLIEKEKGILPLFLG